MIIYNVTTKISWEISKDWLQWMRETHMPEVIATGYFNDSKLLLLLETDDEEGPTYAAQYFAESIEKYHEYLSRAAATLRDSAFNKWGNQFISFRSVMEVIN